MIIPAQLKDLDKIFEIYQTAREFMRQNGNENQWRANYPSRAVLENDILKKQLFILVKDGVACGVFAFIIGDDPTYDRIEGCWKYSATYGTIHRIASDGTVNGVFNECLNYCKSKIAYIRADTGEKNFVMQHLFAKHGFEKSGIIHLMDGSPRIAYEFTLNK